MKIVCVRALRVRDVYFILLNWRWMTSKIELWARVGHDLVQCCFVNSSLTHHTNEIRCQTGNAKKKTNQRKLWQAQNASTDERTSQAKHQRERRKTKCDRKSFLFLRLLLKLWRRSHRLLRQRQQLTNYRALEHSMNIAHKVRWPCCHFDHRHAVFAIFNRIHTGRSDECETVCSFCVHTHISFNETTTKKCIHEWTKWSRRSQSAERILCFFSFRLFVNWISSRHAELYVAGGWSWCNRSMQRVNVRATAERMIYQNQRIIVCRLPFAILAFDVKCVWNMSILSIDCRLRANNKFIFVVGNW